MSAVLVAVLYATAGVADYWVVGVDNRQPLVFRNPTPPSAAVRVADLLP